MVRIDNHLGRIEVSEGYFTSLIGRTASECFGVAGLARSGAGQGIRLAVSRGNLPGKGVNVKNVGGELVIDLHIAVTYGVNIAVIVKSIIHKVTYTVEAACGLNVAKVNVYVASMKTP